MAIAVFAKPDGGGHRRFSLVYSCRPEPSLSARPYGQPWRHGLVPVVGSAPVPAHGKKLCGPDLMSDTAVCVENLSKRYLLGHRSARRATYTALRDVIGQEARTFARKAADFWRGRQIVEGDR